MLKLDIVTNIVSTLIECTIYTAILNAYWKYESKYRYVVSTLAAALFFVVGFFFSDSPVLQMALGVAVIIGYSMIVMHGGLWQSATIALVLLINTLLVNLADQSVRGNFYRGTAVRNRLSTPLLPRWHMWH